MFEIQPEIREKYKKKLLVIPSYNADKKFYLGENLSNFDQLAYSLGEIRSHEATITQDGISFIEETHGFKGLSEALFKDGWFPEDFQSAKEIGEWLKSLKPD